MPRRLLSLLMAVALALAFLPAVADGLNAGKQPTCCSGVMCPMHHDIDQKIACDMDLGHQDAQFQACPSTNQHNAALLFIPVALAILLFDWLVDSTLIVAPPLTVSNPHDVLSPPPRIVLP